MEKEFEISGCISVPKETTYDSFYEKFIEFIESNNWSFGGGINEIIDGYYVDSNGEKIRHVLDDYGLDKNI